MMELRNSKEKEERTVIRLKDIPRPKIRKVVHKSMLKYYNNVHYENIDIIKKILRKLKVEARTNEVNNIRNELKKWLSTNVDKVEDKESKKNILLNNEKKLITNDSEEISSKNIPQSAENSKQVDETPDIPAVPSPICINCSLIKEPVVIDLTSDCDDVKIEKNEVQIDENDNYDLKAVLNAHRPDDNSFMKAGSFTNNEVNRDDSANVQQQLYYSSWPFFNSYFYGINPYINPYYYLSPNTIL